MRRLHGWALSWILRINTSAARHSLPVEIEYIGPDSSAANLRSALALELPS
jgi:hypothetical protein